MSHRVWSPGSVNNSISRWELLCCRQSSSFRSVFRWKHFLEEWQNYQSSRRRLDITTTATIGSHVEVTNHSQCSAVDCHGRRRLECRSSSWWYLHEENSILLLLGSKLCALSVLGTILGVLFCETLSVMDIASAGRDNWFTGCLCWHGLQYVW